MKRAFDKLMVTGKVFRGIANTAPNDTLTKTHFGAYDPQSGTMHFDPSGLNAANGGDPSAIRNLVNTALHEGAHFLGYDHSPPIWAGSYDLYAEAPFSLLSPGDNSCLIN